MVVVNALALRPQGAGVSTYVRELLAALPPEAQASATAIVQADAAGDLPATVGRRILAPASGARRAALSLAADPGSGVFHGLDVDTPIRRGGPVVATLHDLSAFDTPWAMSRARALAERALIRRAARRAEVIIAVSAFTAERVKALLGRDSEVILEAPGPLMAPPPAAELERVQSSYALPGRFVLTVGSVEPRKDVTRLAEACRAVGVPLLLAGSDLYGAVDLGGGVTRLGFVPAGDLPALYAAASVVAYASVYEGFGLPPVEAMACGAALVCTAVADLREICGDAAEVVRVGDSKDLARGLAAALDPERSAELRAGAPAAAGALSWTRAAAETAAVWSRLGG